MWRLARAFVTVLCVSAMASSTPMLAEVGQGCRYWVQVSREGFGGEQAAQVCDVGNVVDWLGVVPEAKVSTQAPQVTLNDSFTVTIYLARRTFPYEMLPVPPSGSAMLVTERVYPVADSGPVAFVPTRSIFHEPGGYPRWVVLAGWRSLDASKRVPTVLTKLGMLQPTATRTTPTSTPTTVTSATGSSRHGPDLVTLLFLVAILVSVGIAIRRRAGRTHPQIVDGLDGHSESSHHG
jgi:hypothetical protein